MKRVTHYELSPREVTILKLTQAAAEVEGIARTVKRDAILAAKDARLPVRLIGRYASLSGAAVSRYGRPDPPLPVVWEGRAGVRGAES